MSAPLLSIRDLVVHYGVIRALSGISLEVPEGRIVALIGANGAGKSTTLRAISGLVRPTSGEVSFAGRSLAGLASHEIVALGVAQAPEGRGIFLNLTVRENLDLGAYLRRDRAGIEADREKAFSLFPILKERSHQVSGTLSGGEQQMLAVARALMSRPRLLLLDEPSLGLAPLIVKQIFEVLAELNSRGMTLFLVEQNAFHALKLAHRGYVMVSGAITMSGTGQELLARPEVRAAYLEGG
ncbi:MAG TPA: ABC transporter ATP-binding protein, partial [Anaeromyxobacteraceae bacterium]|nr:ABC transporter ATP-binding protein [Anaeromyxobacteraceae bacterium]